MCQVKQQGKDVRIPASNTISSFRDVTERRGLWTAFLSIKPQNRRGQGAEMGLVLQVEETNGELPSALCLPLGLGCMHHRVISQPGLVAEAGGVVPAS